jgi:hypothetical protein
MKKKMYLVAKMESWYENGYQTSVWDFAPSAGAANCVLLAEFEIDVPDISKEDIIKKCFPKLDEMRKEIDAGAGRAKQDVDKLQSKLLQLTHITDPKPQHEPEAEDAEVRETWFFTFGGDHAHPNGYVQVNDATHAEARDAMVQHFGTKWAFQYDAKGFEGQPEKYDLNCVLRLDRHGDFDDDIPF